MKHIKLAVGKYLGVMKDIIKTYAASLQAVIMIITCVICLGIDVVILMEILKMISIGNFLQDITVLLADKKSADLIKIIAAFLFLQLFIFGRKFGFF
jgi:hypothetical protein